MTKHVERYVGSKVWLISFINIFFGLSMSIIAYVMSTYYAQASGNDNVGLFYFIPSILMIFVSINLHRLMWKLGKSLVLLGIMIVQLTLIFFLVQFDVSILGAIILMVYGMGTGIVWSSLDMALETYSSDSRSGRIRGIQLTCMNLGVLIGPFLSTQLLEWYGFMGIFFAMFLIYSAMFILALFGLRALGNEVRDMSNAKGLLKRAWKMPVFRYIYWVSFTLDFFYVLMVIYSPIYLRSIGFTWTEIGLMFTIMLVPFVLLQYPAGLLADKKCSEKPLLAIGILLILISVVTMFFLPEASFVLWALALTTGRIGACTVEIMRDSYFYKGIDGLDVGIINIFRTARTVAFIVGSVLSFFILLVFPQSIELIFLLIAGACLIAFYPLSKLKKY